MTGKPAASMLVALASTMAMACAPTAAARDGRLSWQLDSGIELHLSAVYRYDVNDFDAEGVESGPRFVDARGSRRKELTFGLAMREGFDAVIGYEYEGEAWLDTYVRVQSRAAFDVDVGAVRAGYSKVPFGLERLTSTKANSFLELALPSQALTDGRRTGIDWAWHPGAIALNVGYYLGQDLQGDNDGTTFAGRIAWAPRDAPGDVLHVGIARSRERRHATTDGQDVRHPPSIRIGSPPEAGLTSSRLTDTGVLEGVGAIDRTGLEGVWIRGGVSVQAEWLRADVPLSDAGSFKAQGSYAFISWVPTGESRSYTDGNVGDVLPRARGGAWELLLRYSELDLDDGPVRGGSEYNWTLGCNWYANRHLKLQANWVRAGSASMSTALEILELRGQIRF